MQNRLRPARPNAFPNSSVFVQQLSHNITIIHFLGSILFSFMDLSSRLLSLPLPFSHFVCWWVSFSIIRCYVLSHSMCAEAWLLFLFPTNKTVSYLSIWSSFLWHYSVKTRINHSTFSKLSECSRPWRCQHKSMHFRCTTTLLWQQKLGEPVVSHSEERKSEIWPFKCHFFSFGANFFFNWSCENPNCLEPFHLLNFSLSSSYQMQKISRARYQVRSCQVNWHFQLAFETERQRKCL